MCSTHFYPQNIAGFFGFVAQNLALYRLLLLPLLSLFFGASGLGIPFFQSLQLIHSVTVRRASRWYIPYPDAIYPVKNKIMTQFLIRTVEAKTDGRLAEGLVDKAEVTYLYGGHQGCIKN